MWGRQVLRTNQSLVMRSCTCREVPYVPARISDSYFMREAIACNSVACYRHGRTLGMTNRSEKYRW